MVDSSEAMFVCGVCVVVVVDGGRLEQSVDQVQRRNKLTDLPIARSSLRRQDQSVGDSDLSWLGREGTRTHGWEQAGRVPEED